MITNQFSGLMLMPMAVGNFLDHFNAPIDQKIVEELEQSDPELAQKYKDRAQRWSQGI